MIEQTRASVEFSTLRTQMDVLGALILRETHVRFGRTRLGFAWVILEPIVHAVILTALYFVLQRKAPLGGSMPLFLFTGLLPYFLWNKVSRRLVSSFTTDRSLLGLPLVSGLDILVARAFLEGAAWLVAATTLVSLLVSTGYGTWPYDLQKLCSAVGMTFILSFGVGSINATLSTLFRSWQNVFDLLFRPLYICSGVFYLVDQLPDAARSILIWNPLVHAIEWYRSSFYPAYSSMTLDEAYLVKWAICSLLIGLMLERLARRRISAE